MSPESVLIASGLDPGQRLRSTKEHCPTTVVRAKRNSTHSGGSAYGIFRGIADVGFCGFHALQHNRIEYRQSCSRIRYVSDEEAARKGGRMSVARSARATRG